MIWALDLDDFNNRCGQGAHPLLKTIASVLGPNRAPGYVDSKPAHNPEGSLKIQGPPKSKKCWNSAIGAIKNVMVVDHPPIQEEHFLPEVPGIRPPPGVPVCAKQCWDPENGVIVMEVTNYQPGRSEHSMPVVERILPVAGVRRPPGMEECKCWDPNKGHIRNTAVNHPPIQQEHFLPEVPGVRPPPGVEVCPPASGPPDSGSVSPPGTGSEGECWNPHERMTVNHPPIQPEHFLPEIPGVRPPVCPPGTKTHPPPSGELCHNICLLSSCEGSENCCNPCEGSEKCL